MPKHVSNREFGGFKEHTVQIYQCKSMPMSTEYIHTIGIEQRPPLTGFPRLSH